MKCPKCKNHGFKKSDDMPTRTRVYKTDHIGNDTYRYKICLQCGKKFVTIERLDRQIEERQAG